jgi:acetyl-CoA synthetase
LPGSEADVVDETGKSLPPGVGGRLVLKRPFPHMMRTVWGDDARFAREWNVVPGGFYHTGDVALKDEQGYICVLGRVDDVLNVAGHRLSTMEIESALVSHRSVAEAAAVGKPDDLKGQAIAVFVTLESGYAPSESLRKELREHVVKEIGALARPDDIHFTDALPKTRSGKIMRRLLRDIAAGVESGGDTSTLEDLSVLVRLRRFEEQQRAAEEE